MLLVAGLSPAVTVDRKETGTASDGLLESYDSLSWNRINTDFDMAVGYAERGLSLARQTGDRGMEAKFLINLGAAYSKASDFTRGREYISGALHIAESLGDKPLLGLAYSSMANTLNSCSRSKEALVYYLKALSIAEAEGDESRTAALYGNIGALLANRNQWRRASSYYRKARKLAEETCDTANLSSIYFNTGLVHRALGNSDSAFWYLSAADGMAAAAGDNYIRIFTLMGLAACYEGAGDADRSLEANTEALALAESVGYAGPINDARKSIIFNRLAMGDYALVTAQAEELLSLLDSTDYKQFYDLHYAATVAGIRLGDSEGALRHMEAMLSYIAKNNDAESWNALAGMEAGYEAERKEMRIAVLDARNRLYFTIASVCTVAAVMLAIVMVLYHRYQKLKRDRTAEEMENLKRRSQLTAAQSLLDGETMERSRISRELHDGLGGLLTMIKLNLAQVQKNAPCREEKLERAIALTDRTISEMRRMAHNLMPETIERFGLKTVLQEYCNGSDTVTFHFFGKERRFGIRTEINLYRTACELVNNALKHSGATEIHVQLIISEGKLCLTVQDNGRGVFGTPRRKYMNTVRSRAELLGSSVDICSHPERGTEVSLEMDISSL